MNVKKITNVNILRQVLRHKFLLLLICKLHVGEKTAYLFAGSLRYLTYCQNKPT